MSEQAPPVGNNSSTETLRLKSDLETFQLDNELIVFSETAQSLVGLNAAAAVVFNAISKGTSSAQLVPIVMEQLSTTPEQASQWVESTIEALQAHNMILHSLRYSSPERKEDVTGPNSAPTVSPSIRAFSPISSPIEQRYKLLETRILIRFAHPAQMKMVNAVIGHLLVNEPGEPDLVLDVLRVKVSDRSNRNDIYSNGLPIASASKVDRLGPQVKAIVWQAAVNAYQFLFYIHAGVVGLEKSCILLPAAAGSGKSSLTAALTHAGFRYYSDEVALIDSASFRVRPMPLAICVKSTGWDLMSRYFPEISTLPIHGREDGKIVKYLPPPTAAAAQPSLPVSHIIFPRHAEAARTEIHRLTRSEALGRLMAECVALRQRLDRANVAQIVGWMSEIDCYALTFGALGQAVELVKDVTNFKKMQSE